MILKFENPEAVYLIISLIRSGVQSPQAFNILNSVYDFLTDKRFYLKTKEIKRSTVLEWAIEELEKPKDDL